MALSSRVFFALSLTSMALIACQGDALTLSKKDNAQKTISNTPNADSSQPSETQTPDLYNVTEKLTSKSLVLALSWQAGFCETHEKKPECQSQRGDRYDATHFALHGLWPQPRNKAYCGNNSTDRSRSKRGHWLDLPSVQTSVATRKRLQKIMPGTRSALDRHEWVKHGTCYSKAAETYYRDSLALMDVVNNSEVQKLFVSNIGKYLSGKLIRAAFDKSFGRGSGKRVRIACKRDGKRQLITEITLGLRGVVGATPDLGRLMGRARTTKPGCPGGIVDPVGLQ